MSALPGPSMPTPTPTAAEHAPPATGTAAYRWLIGQPGARAMMAAGLAARLPVAMIGIGAMLLVAARTGSYRLAGLTTAAIALAGAAAGPAIARRIDRSGPRAVLPVLAAAHLVAGTAFLIAALAGLPAPALLGCAVATGATLPQVGPVARQRWAAWLGGDPRLDTAYALESAIDELTFVTGPGAASALAGLSAYAGTATAVLLAAVGTLAFAALPALDSPVPASPVPAAVAGPSVVPAGSDGSVLRTSGIVPLLVAAAALGMFFGATDVALVAYGRAHGWGGAAGLLPSTLTAANLAAGLCYGAIRWRVSLVRRFAVAAGLFGLVAVTAPVAAAVGGIGAVVVAVVGTGLPLTPLIVSSTAIVGERVPAHRRTEGFGWTVIANSVGVSAGAPLAGVLVDHSGATSALVVLPIGGLAVASTALIAAWRLTPRRLRSRRAAARARSDGAVTGRVAVR